MGRVSLRLVVATVFLSFALFITGVAVFVTQTTGAQSSLPTISFHEITVGADLSVIGATEIPEGETVTIGIELDRTLTQSLADDLVINTSYQENVFAGSNFEDISSVTGVRAFSTVSNSEAYTETLGFGFQFYTETYNTIAVHTNGFIGFTDDPDDLLNSTGDPDGYRGDDTPAIEGEVVPIVAPLLSAINYFDPGGLDQAPAFYGVRLGAGTDEDRYIIQYTNARVRVGVGVRVLATFQVALYANGRIELRYQDIPSSVQQNAKIGISNGSGTGMYEEFSYIESRLSESDTRIVYTPASRVNAVIKDADGETFTDFGILDLIAVDEVSGTIQLVNRNREDTNWDGDQVYTVELVSVSPLIVFTGTVATYTFTDDDLPEVTLEYVCTAVCDRAEVAEGASLNWIVGLTNPAPTGAPETVTVNLEVLGGTATETLDYTLPASITIAEDTTRTIFTFSPTDDNLAERTEELIIGISSVEYGDNRLQSSINFTVYITDNDPRPTISLDPVEPIIEGDTRVVTARLGAELGFSISVTLIATDNSATSSTDYDLVTDTMMIPAGSLTADFEVVTLVDQLSEELETFELSLQVPPETVGLGVNATRAVRILDEAHLVNFSRSEEMVLEGQELKVRLDAKGLVGYNLTIDIATSTAGFDFAQDITSVKFAQGQGEDVLVAQEETVTLFPQTFAIMSSTRLIELTFEVANDTEIEPGELFTLEATSPNGYVTIDSNTVEVTLRDYIVAVDLSVIGPTDIPEGEMVTIGIELDRPLARFLADSLVAGVSYQTEAFADSNFENITSLIADVRYPKSSNNEAYLQALGFDFEFYGETYSNIAVHTNGFIGFTDDANDLIDETNAFFGRNRGDETPAIEGKVVPIVAPLLSAIDPRPHSFLASRDHPNSYGVHLGAGTAEERYIVQYDRARLNEQPGGPRVVTTFQVALYADGRIEFRYKDIPSAAQEAAKIGISNGTETGRYEEFSYRESKLSESDVRIVYTPVPVTNVVIKDVDGKAVTSFDIRDIITVDGVSGTIELHNQENTDWDGTRTYTAELGSASPLFVTGTVATYTFTEDDLPEVTLEYDMCSTVCDRAEVAEGDSLILVVRLTNAAPTGAPEAVTVNLADLGGTATETLDYILPASITIAEGTAQTTFTFSPVDDNLAEDIENLTIGFSSVEYGGNQLQSEVSFELTITDDELRPTLSLELSELSVDEGSGVTVAAVLSGPFAEGVEVLLEIVGGTADTADYSTPTILLDTIPAGETRVAFVITAAVDGIYEGLVAETLELRLSIPARGATIPAAVRTLTINDLETLPTLSLNGAMDVGEESGILRLTVDLSDPLDENVELTLAVSGDVNTDDYSLTPTLTILAGALSGVFELRTKNDKIYEGTETVVLTLSGETVGADAESLLPEIATFRIIDDEDPAQITVNPIPPVSEGETIEVEVVLMTISAEDVTVTLDVATTGDAEPTDYTLPDSLIETIVAGNRIATFQIDTTPNDRLYEGAETIDFEFTALDGTVAATALIRDRDEAPTVAFETSRPVTVAEGSTVTLLVVLNGTLAESEIVVDFTVSGTADEGVDYSSVERSVTIPSGETSAIVSIFATDDQFTEGAETLELRLLSASSGVNVATPNVVDVTIIDDDIVTIGFALSSYSITENSGLQEIEIEVKGGTLAEPLTVAVATVARTATAPDDYADTRHEIVLSTTDTRGSILIPIELDSLIEGTESFEVVLSLPENSPLSDGVVFDPMMATVSISDEVTVGFIDGPYEVNEASGTVELTVGIVGGGTLDTDVTLGVNYATSDITALAGEDYQTRSATITLVASTNSQVVLIPITDDSKPENDESFEVSLSVGDSSVDLNNFNFQLNPDVATVTIIDNDDAPVVSEPPEGVVVAATLSVPELSVSEGDSTTLNIYLSDPTSEDVTVTLTVVDGGSADVTVDYEPLLVPAVIRAGLSELTVSIRTLDDELIEETEMFELRLSVLSGPAVTGALDRVTVSIIDNDEASLPTVSLESLGQVNEPHPGGHSEMRKNTSLTVTVRLSGALESTVTVSLLATNESAEDDDYTISPASVTILPGATVAEFTLSALRNNLQQRNIEYFEGTEILTLEPVAIIAEGSVRLPTDGSVPHQVAISESLPVPELEVTVNGGPTSFNEGQQRIELVAVPDDVTEFTVTLTLRRRADSTAGDTDFELDPDTVEIGPGSVAFLYLDIIDDVIYEEDETLIFEGYATGGGIELPVRPLVTEIIDDNDRPTLIGPVGEVTEGHSTTIEVSLTSILKVPVSVSLAYGVGSTASQSDYILSEIDAEIAAGKLTATFSLEAVQNELYELTETLILVPSASGVGLEEITGEPGVITIS